MTARRIICCVAAVLAVGGGAFSAAADETGLASSHDLRREGGRLCFLDHYHYGSGSGSTRRAAEISAINSWSSFVDFEYGSDWARYSRAASKSMKCTGGSSYDCQVEARPCR